MNGRPGTKAELAMLAKAAGLVDVWCDEAEGDLLRSLHAKLTAPFKPRPDLPDIRAIDRALGDGYGVLTVNAPEAWWASLARRAAAVGATVEEAKEIGPWLATQTWAKSLTVDRVIAGWPSYLARARAAKGEHDDLGGEFGARRDDWTPD